VGKTEQWMERQKVEHLEDMKDGMKEKRLEHTKDWMKGQQLVKQMDLQLVELMGEKLEQTKESKKVMQLEVRKANW